MSDVIVRLSRADAQRIREALDWSVLMLVKGRKFDMLDDLKRIRPALDAALAGDPAPEAERANLHIRIEKDDTIPAFAGFAYHPEQGDDRLVLLNVYATFSAARDAEMPVREILVGSLMHEFGHILEEWFGLEFSEERIEGIVQSYQQANWGYEPPAPTAATGHDE